MALSKEEQKAASDRIMAKEPLTAEERQLYEILTRTPEQYLPPDPETGERVCGICGEVFNRIPGTKESPEIPALEQFSDHQAEHSPSAGQWVEAHRRIQAGKERQKGQTP